MSESFNIHSGVSPFSHLSLSQHRFTYDSKLSGHLSAKSHRYTRGVNVKGL